MVLREEEVGEAREVNNWFRQWVSQVPVERLILGQYEEYGDDAVPACDQCAEVCEWVYFSRKQGRGGEVIVCGKCVDRVQHGAGTGQWKQFVREGLEQHMGACERLSNRAGQLLTGAPEPRPAPAQAPPQHGIDFALVPVAPPAQVPPQLPLQLALAPEAPPAQPPAVPASEGCPLAAQPRLVLQPGRGPTRKDKSEWRRYNAMEVRNRRWADQLVPIVYDYFDLGPDYKCNTLDIMRRYQESYGCDHDPLSLPSLYKILPRLGLEIGQETMFHFGNRAYREVYGLTPKKDNGLPKSKT